jgi:hypothetical protein
MGMMIKVKITPTISQEYQARCPEGIPWALREEGTHEVTLEMARVILADARFNSDTKAFDVGLYGMPLPVFNAYRALAIRVEKAIDAATVEAKTPSV